MKVPNSIIGKIKKIGSEHTIEILELIKEAYEMGHNDGMNEMYGKMTG